MVRPLTPSQRLLRHLMHALLLLCLVLGTPASATEQRVALVIGNAGYEGEGRLSNPINDARLVADTLRKLGFKVISPKGPSKDAVYEDLDKEALQQAFIDFGKVAKSAEVVFVYYSGHGLRGTNGRNYLVPVKSVIESDDHIRLRSVPVDDLLEELGSAEQQLRIVVLDACRNNPFGDRKKGFGEKGLVRPNAVLSGTLMAFATGEGQTALDGRGSTSPYVEALVARLKEPIEIKDVFNRVARDVYEKTGKKQRPSKVDDVLGEFFLAGRPATPTAGTQLASLKPEPISATAQPGQDAGMSLEDLEREESVRKQWAQWQAKMKADYDKTVAFRGSADLQVKAWDRFLVAWGQDNPLSQEDEALRKQAKNQLVQKAGNSGESVVGVPVPSASPPIATSSPSGGVALAAVKENRDSDKRLIPQDGCDEFFDAGYIYEGDFGKVLSHTLNNRGSTELDIFQDEQQSPQVDVKFPNIVGFTIPEFNYSPELMANCGGTWCIGGNSGRKFAAINSMQSLKWIETAPKKHLAAVRVNKRLIDDSNRDLIRDKFFVIKYKTLGRFFSAENTLIGDFKNTACQQIGVHFCGDGLLESGKEICDPADLNKVNWGSGGCSSKCQPQ